MSFVFIPILIVAFLVVVGAVFAIKKIFGKSRAEIENEEQRDSFGKQGEHEVGKILAKLPEEYRIYNDVMLYGSTSTVQIDHVVVSVYGIFVIETKNYKGEIYGREKDKTWKKSWRGTIKEFYNPIRQNKAHVAALKMNTRIKSDNVYVPIIAFSDEADISKLDVSLIRLKSRTATAVNFNHLIAKITKQKEKLLSETQVEKFCILIEKLRLDSEKHAKKHVKNIEKSIINKKEFSGYGKCPRCTGKLILRNGRRGFFLGCSNFPKCRYTKNV